MTEPVTSSGAQQTPLQYTCSSNNQFTFCASQGSGDYYVAIPRSQSPQNDISRIRDWFHNSNYTPQPINDPPAGTDVFENTRVYRVTDFLPKIVTARNGVRDDVVGPNCYQTVLTAEGYQGVQGRYVDTSEFRYYLKRDFQEASCSKNIYGSIVVYDTTLIPFDAGDHAAFHLLGSLVFQKGGWQNYYPYEVATVDGAMQLINEHWRPPPEDRFGGPPTQGPEEHYNYMCYERRTSFPERHTSSTARDRDWFLPLIQYYNARLQEISRYTWTDFKERRITLLTIENMWNVTSDFRERIENMGPYDNFIDVELRIDDYIIEAFEKLKSLSWQYDVMTQTYDPMRNRWQLEDLYKARYVIFDDNFYDELKLYLRLLKIPETRWGTITVKFVEKIKTYDPLYLAQYNQRIPYLNILREVVASN